MYKLLLLISIKRNRWLFDIIMEVIEIFLSFIGLINFNEWDFMFRILFYMNEDLFYYIIYFLDLENYIIVRFLYMLILDWLILEIFIENFYFIVIKLLYGFCILEIVCNFYFENGLLLLYNVFMWFFCWDRKYFVVILIKFVLILYFKFLIWYKNINGNVDIVDMKG